MKRKLILPLAVAMAAATQVQAQSPDLEQPFAVQSGGETLDIGMVGHAAPLFTDWDGDGLKDLLVGEFGIDDVMGTLRVYKNTGNARSPKFNDFIHVKAGGDVQLVPTG